MKDVVLQEPLTELTASIVVDLEFANTLRLTPGIHRKPNIIEGGYPDLPDWRSLEGSQEAFDGSAGMSPALEAPQESTSA